MKSTLLLVSLLAMSGCASSNNSPSPNDDPSASGDDPVADDPAMPPPRTPTVDDDSGVFDLGDRSPADAGASHDAEVAPADASVVTTACAGTMQAGDVQIVELMISSQSGSGDHGEWIELENTRNCVLEVQGLVIASPRGTSSDIATIAQSLQVPPGGRFLIADSASSTDNNNLPSVAATWGAADVLKNDGDTVSVTLGTTTIDTLTFPKLSLVAGRSVSFPSDCLPTDRSNWARWSLSHNAWYQTFEGTPGSDNNDVACY